MNNHECRIIKIDKDALYEFIYENFIVNHEEFMDMDAVGSMNTFAINCETGEFIFGAHKDENEKGTVKLYRDKKLIDEVICENVGCEYGEYDCGTV